MKYSASSAAWELRAPSCQFGKAAETLLMQAMRPGERPPEDLDKCDDLISVTI